jgi:hypothetical protein
MNDLSPTSAYVQRKSRRVLRGWKMKHSRHRSVRLLSRLFAILVLMVALAGCNYPAGGWGGGGPCGCTPDDKRSICMMFA